MGAINGYCTDCGEKRPLTYENEACAPCGEAREQASLEEAGDRFVDEGLARWSETGTSRR